MATSIGSLALKLVADPTGLVGGLTRAAASITSFATGAISTIAGIPGKAIGALGSIGLAGLGLDRISASVQGLLGEPLKLAAAAESAALSIRIMVGDADKAKKLLEDIQTFAVATPFESGELIDASKQLLAMGISSDKVVDSLKLLGSVGTGLGVPIGEMAQIFGRVRSKGVAMTEDLNMFAERGIPIWKALGEVLGIDETRVRSFAEAGRIGFNEVARAFMAMNAPGAQFAGMLEEQSQTLQGKFSTLADNFHIALRNVGQAAAKGLGLKDLMDSGSSALEYIANNVQSLLLPAFEAAGGVIRGVADVLGGLWEDYGKPALEALANGFTGTEGRFDSFREGTVNAIEVVVLAVVSAAEEIQRAINSLLGTIQSLTEKVKEYKGTAETETEAAKGKGVGWMTFTPLGVIGGGWQSLKKLFGGGEAAAADMEEAANEAAAPIESARERVRASFEAMRQRMTSAVEGLANENDYIDTLNGIGGVPDITDPNAKKPVKQIRMQLAGALESGSQASQSVISKAIAEGLVGGKNDVQKQQLAVAQQQLTAAQEANRLLAAGGVGLADLG